MDEHPFFGYRLEGLLIHVDGEHDGILLCASCHRYSKIIRIEVAHVRDKRLRLVEGAPTVDDFQSTLWIRGHHALQGMDHLLWWKIHAQQQSVRQPFLARLGIYKFRLEHRSNDYPLWGILSNFVDVWRPLSWDPLLQRCTDLVKGTFQGRLIIKGLIR